MYDDYKLALTSSSYDAFFIDRHCIDYGILLRTAHEKYQMLTLNRKDDTSEIQKHCLE